jgi:hypothetical protein
MSNDDHHSREAELLKRKRELEQQLAAQTDTSQTGSTLATAPSPCKDATSSDVTTELRETFNEAFETIYMLEEALSPVANPPYAAFFRACSNDAAAEVRSLLLSGLIEINHVANGVTGLHLAACNGNIAVVQALLENGCEVDVQMGLVNAPYSAELNGATPYILAKANRQHYVANLLRGKGANPTARTENGHTAETLIPYLSQTIPGITAINMRVQ